jgi:hypothetical protein
MRKLLDFPDYGTIASDLGTSSSDTELLLDFIVHVRISSFHPIDMIMIIYSRSYSETAPCRIVAFKILIIKPGG